MNGLPKFCFLELHYGVRIAHRLFTGAVERQLPFSFTVLTVYLSSMRISETILVIPPNDPEAVQILLIAESLGLKVIRSRQPHGATLEKEPAVLDAVYKSGCKNIVIVEIPGPNEEARLKKAGFGVYIIDHHRYTGLDRAQNLKTGRLLPASLIQFLRLFKVSKKQLQKLGFNPRMVRAIAWMDQGFVWELRNRGYDWGEIQDVLNHQKSLMELVRQDTRSGKRDQAADAAWKGRVKWGRFFVVSTDQDVEIRSKISLLSAFAYKKRVPCIILENGREFMYVQESRYAVALYERFGGFTYGMDRNWGYSNRHESTKINLEDVKAFLEVERKKRLK